MRQSIALGRWVSVPRNKSTSNIHPTHDETRTPAAPSQDISISHSPLGGELSPQKPPEIEHSTSTRPTHPTDLPVFFSSQWQCALEPQVITTFGARRRRRRSPSSSGIRQRIFRRRVRKEIGLSAAQGRSQNWVPAEKMLSPAQTTKMTSLADLLICK